jgi:hypothetical protein
MKRTFGPFYGGDKRDDESADRQSTSGEAGPGEGRTWRSRRPCIDAS